MGPRTFKSLVAEHDGGVIGMIGFDHWTPSSVTMHLWIPDTRCLPVLIPAAFDYAFRQADKRMVVGTIPSDNAASLAFSKWMGFSEIGRIKDGWDDGVDLIAMQLLRTDWEK